MRPSSRHKSTRRKLTRRLFLQAPASKTRRDCLRAKSASFVHQGRCRQSSQSIPASNIGIRLTLYSSDVFPNRKCALRFARVCGMRRLSNAPHVFLRRAGLTSTGRYARKLGRPLLGGKAVVLCQRPCGSALRRALLERVDVLQKTDRATKAHSDLKCDRTHNRKGAAVPREISV